MAKQSKQDRLKRLNNGCCPIHGLSMGQIGWNPSEVYEYVVECPRRDCKITCVTSGPEDPVHLTQEFKHLLM